MDCVIGGDSVSRDRRPRPPAEGARQLEWLKEEGVDICDTFEIDSMRFSKLPQSQPSLDASTGSSTTVNVDESTSMSDAVVARNE